MHFDTLNQPVIQKIIQAICLTLIHSLWQGLFVAVVAGFILASSKKAKPSLRYNLLSALLFGFLIVNGITFFREMSIRDETVSQHSGQIWSVQVAGHDAANALTFHVLGQSNVGNSWLDAAMQFSGSHASLIVAFWLFIFSLKTMQAAAGLLYIQKVKTKKVSQISENWNMHFKVLCKKLNIKQEVRLVESASIAVPIVIGVLKPVILLPVGLITNLSVLEVEAILLHELAHIKRQDYLLNLIQIGSENVFFFNPMILWLSFLIREEREHCCDDMAISVMENKTSLVHALVSFQEYSRSGSKLEMAFSKKRNHLLDRIKRIIYNNNKSLNAMEKLFVTISLVTAAALTAAISQALPPKNIAAVAPKERHELVRQEPTEDYVPIFADTLPSKNKTTKANLQIHSANIYTQDEGVSTYNVHKDGKEYEIIQKNGVTTSLKVEGKDIPESQFATYKSDIDKILAEVKVAHENAENDRREAGKMRAEAEVQRQHADEQRHQADLQRKQAEESRVLADIQRDQAEKMREVAEQQRLVADKQREEADAMRLQAEKHREEADVQRKEAEKDREAYEKMQAELINDLVQNGVIKDKTKLSYKLSQEELIVNGVKQRADLHQKFKEKYIKDKKVEMVYNYSGRTGYTTTGFIYTR